ncbi:MAG: hypothetical protein NTY53_23535 [Kiritimatiellaeota bacterium]|nr:hypothetical protein [Kiritimatiellota bacterium]
MHQKITFALPPEGTLSANHAMDDPLPARLSAKAGLDFGGGFR